MTPMLMHRSSAHSSFVPFEIPEIGISHQKSARRLNQELEKACTIYKKCRFLPLNSILRSVLQTGHITHQGQSYTIDKLLPDGLHLGAPASEYLADKISELFISERVLM